MTVAASAALASIFPIEAAKALFDYSIHNFMLRYYLAEGGVDPDKEVQIRCRDALRALGYKAPETNSIKHTFLFGKTKVFDSDRPEDYLKSFAIRRVEWPPRVRHGKR